MFALVIEQGHEPFKFEHFPETLQSWVLVAGGFAALGLLIWLLIKLLNYLMGVQQERQWSLANRLLAILLGGVVLTLLPATLQGLWNTMNWVDPASQAPPPPHWYDPLQIQLQMPYSQLLLLFGAGCALTAILVPVILNVRQLRWRRIWALAKLSFKEALRRRVLWAFSFLLVMFLFASWFLPYKPEDQVRNYVRAVYWTMTPLLLFTAGLLAAFSIPADLRNQTMHTIVTKPVERFEIILGRFLGFTMLMTLVLIVMNLLSLVYVARGVDPEAAEESLKARVPIYGELIVRNPKNVGHEWDYRQYITGAAADEDATWTFYRLPRDLGAGMDTVRCEFTFDIFRTTKGEENRGIFCTFIFKNGQWDERRLDEYQQERDKQLGEPPDPALAAQARREQWPNDRLLAVRLNSLAEKYGYYEVPSKEVVDYHTLFVDVPASLFTSQAAASPGQRPPLQVLVRCESATQYLGVAKHDLYLLAAERSFPVNFFKGAVGLFYRLCLVIGIAVTCSTYLSGVISFLVAMFIYLLGLGAEFIDMVAKGKTPGGGPVEAALRLGSGVPTAMPLEETPVVSIAKQTDQFFQWMMGLVLKAIPNVDRFDLSDHVAQGFDVSGRLLAGAGLYLVAYLLLWLVLAYYLIRSREVAA
jgi:ABC-type transport system involved in multi-copper enzyme maturation permease subunit